MRPGAEPMLGGEHRRGNLRLDAFDVSRPVPLSDFVLQFSFYARQRNGRQRARAQLRGFCGASMVIASNGSALTFAWTAQPCATTTIYTLPSDQEMAGRVRDLDC